VSNNLTKKAELVAEMEAGIKVAEEFEKAGAFYGDSKDLRQEKDREVAEFSQTLNDGQRIKFQKELDRLELLSRSSGASIATSILSLDAYIKGKSKVKVEFWGREGLKEGVGQKTDLKATLINPNLDEMVYSFSLKQYRRSGRIQVGSGTYLSTFLGLAYDVAGRGRYQSHDKERTFGSKGKCEDARAEILKDYGVESAKLLDELVILTAGVAALRGNKVYPGDDWWKKKCKGFTESAVPIFEKWFNFLLEHDQDKFIERIFHRAGLGCEHETVVTFCQNGEPRTLNTLSDPTFAKTMKIGKIPINQLEVETKRSGQGEDGCSIDVRLHHTTSGKSSPLMELQIPFTLNRNGAWQLCNEAGRWCKKDKQFVEFGHLRPEKSKELATSTNMWLKVPLGK